VQIAKRSQFQYVEIDGQFESSVAFAPKFWVQAQDQSGGSAPYVISADQCCRENGR
jgi:hypothetical protein